MSTTNKRILLVYAGEQSKLPRFPMSCLVLAAYLRDKGYSPDIVDLRRLPVYDGIIISDYLCVCISSMTGADLKSAIKFSKQFIYDVPIIWGGHHVSATKEIHYGYIDAIVIGEGEKALLKVIQDVEAHKFDKQHRTVYNQDIIDMDELPFPAYDLIDVKQYLDYKDGWSYEVARGCPHRCGFCYAHYFHSSKWRKKSVGKVINDIKKIISQYNVYDFKLIGDNLFVDKKYAMELCKQLTYLNITWTSTCRADYLSKFTDEDMCIIKNSGCKCLQIGAESGNQEVLHYMRKDITPEQILCAVRNCNVYDIKASVSFMVGMPNETSSQILDTLSLYDKVRKDAEVMGIFVYYPYPGTPMYEDAVKLGYSAPNSINQWANIKLKHERMPWHGSLSSQIQTISNISRFNYFISKIPSMSKSNIVKKTGLPFWLINMGILPFKLSAYVRWKCRFFKWGYEWDIFFNMLSKITEVY